MASQDGFQEVVYLFDSSGARIEHEMHYAQFQDLLSHKVALTSHAAQTVKAAYAQVGAGLALRGLVLFLFKVDGTGRLDSAFNLPLDYMAQNAGPGPDLGVGPISMACRGQCPVPWQTINTWHPGEEGANHPAMKVQKAVWRNRLGLKPAPLVQARRTSSQGRVEERRPVDAVMEIDQAMASQVGAGGGRRAMEARITAAFGEAGRVSAQHYQRVSRSAPPISAGSEPSKPDTGRLREELERQQQGYLEQIKGFRDEIQKLKSALRHEQERNRRLQELLRGGI